MEWKRLKQQVSFLENRFIKDGPGLDGDVCKDSLLILGDTNKNVYPLGKDVLCCWNISINFLAN